MLTFLKTAINGATIFLIVTGLTFDTTLSFAEEQGNLWEDDRISVRIDKIEKNDTYPTELRMPGYKYRPPKKGHVYLTVHFTITRIKNVHLGMPEPSAQNNPTLIDSEGREYQLINSQYQGIKYLDGFTGNKNEVVEGATGICLFVFPKSSNLEMLKFYYPYWKSWDPKIVVYDYIEIQPLRN